jgi:hypothetical protein
LGRNEVLEYQSLLRYLETVGKKLRSRKLNVKKIY